jgi:signal recognition particle GTPase
MGFFSFFSKEKKETLDKGLETTKRSVFEKLTRAVAGKDKVDDDVLDNLEEVLVTSDVGVDTTLKVIERIEERVARDKYVSTSELNNILREEIVKLLEENGNGNDTLRYDTAQAPTIRPAGYDNGKGDGNVNGTSNLKQYMNRLSDYLFVLARKINIINGKEEKTWQNTCK